MPISITQKIHIRLLINRFWSILLNIMTSWLKHWGIAFFGGFVYFCSFALNNPCNAKTEWVIAIICLTIAIYQCITGYRLAEWEENRKELEKEAIGEPRPSDPIATVIHKLFKNKK